MERVDVNLGECMVVMVVMMMMMMRGDVNLGKDDHTNSL